MERIHSLDDVVGHKWVISYFKEGLRRGTLPHFIILEGPEGVGKTTIADLVAIELAYGSTSSEQRAEALSIVIDKKHSTDYIKKFECSVEGGKSAALEILEEMHSFANPERNKVILCDECHRFTPGAQDVILSNTEYLKDNVYVFMMTTDISVLQPALKSRAFIIRMPALTQGEMLTVLKKEAESRNLRIQAEGPTLAMIAEWAECKPRTGLRILEGFGNNSSVSAEMIRGLVGILDVSDVLPLLSTLSGSLTAGLTYISEMPLHSSIVPIVSEIVLLKSGGVSYKFSIDDMKRIKMALKDVNTEQLICFLEGITRQPSITRPLLINAYIRSHASRDLILQENSHENLELELQQKSIVLNDITFNKNVQAPTLNELLLHGAVIEKQGSDDILSDDTR